MKTFIITGRTDAYSSPWVAGYVQVGDAAQALAVVAALALKAQAVVKLDEALQDHPDPPGYEPHRAAVQKAVVDHPDPGFRERAEPWCVPSEVTYEAVEAVDLLAVTPDAQP